MLKTSGISERRHQVGVGVPPATPAPAMNECSHGETRPFRSLCRVSPSLPSFITAAAGRAPTPRCHIPWIMEIT